MPMDDLMERVARLERQNLMLRRVLLSALVLVAAVLLMGQVTLPEEVLARKFTVVDDEGNSRIVLGGSAELYGVIVMDESEQPRAVLMMAGENPEMRMYAADERKLVTLQAAPERTFLALSHAATDKVEALLSADANLSMVATCNSEGKARSAVGTRDGAGFIELWDTNGTKVLTQP